MGLFGSLKSVMFQQEGLFLVEYTLSEQAKDGAFLRHALLMDCRRRFVFCSVTGYRPMPSTVRQMGRLQQSLSYGGKHATVVWLIAEHNPQRRLNNTRRPPPREAKKRQKVS